MNSSNRKTTKPRNPNHITLKDLVSELQKLIEAGHGDSIVTCEEYVIQVGTPSAGSGEVHLDGKA